MALLVFNQSGAPVNLVGIVPTCTVPASAAPPARGAPRNVTSELKNLGAPAYAALEVQRLAVPLVYEWTGLPEFSAPGLTIDTPVLSPPAPAPQPGPVPNVVALAALDDATLDDSMQVNVLTLFQPFQLDKTDNVSVIDHITVEGTLSGNGRWRRLLLPVPKWTDQVAWAVDPVGGNDENIGSPANPLKTMAEFTRRVRVAKYGTAFGPYTMLLVNDIPNTDSFQWGPVIEAVPGSMIVTDPDAVIVSDLIVVTGTKTVLGNGVVGVYTPPVGNAKCQISRVVGAFALNDVIEFTSGAAAGKRFYPEEAGATTTLNPRNLGGTVPAPGDTFNLVRLTKMGVQVTGCLQTQSVRMLFLDCWIPGDGLFGTFNNGGSPQWEVTGTQVRFNNCLLNQFVRPGIASRVKFGSGSAPSAVICPGPALGQYMTQRGATVAINCSWVNVLFDLMTFIGTVQMINCEFIGGGIRMGAGDGEIEDGGFGTQLLADATRSFDAPAVFPPSVYVGTGGVGSAGGALVMMRGAKGTMGGGWVGLNPLAPAALHVSRAARLEIGPGPTPTVTAGGADILFEGAVNAMPPLENFAGGVLPPLSPLTTWAQFNAVPFLGNVVSHKSGAVIYTTI